MQALGAYYKCPVSSERIRLGQLVAYTAVYPTDDGEKNFVGEEYFNFAKADEFPNVYEAWAFELVQCELPSYRPRTVLGLPTSGSVFGREVARIGSWRSVSAEKIVTNHARPGVRESSRLELRRHDLTANERIAIAEDIVHHFATTKKAIDLVRECRALPVAIVCVVNGSGLSEYGGVPVISLLDHPLQSFRQDDPAVVTDVEAGRVVFQPKSKEVWASLIESMQAAPR
ncbi:MAG: hypothetical protein HY545_01025 [Candidatus Doudnabacteria bacterium]|nr:hypothetical protein [Candidatus Doudnabacteria bacterium]